MRLLRLEVTDMAGLARGHIVFPETGASIVPAPNERGKSTLVRALELLLTEKASAKTAELKRLRREGAGASRVAAELVLGGKRLRLEKTFDLKLGETRLDLLDEGGGLIGDRAHEEFEDRFRAHVDRTLFDLLRFSQGRALEPLDASGSTRLARALAAEVAVEAADDALLTAVTGFADAQWHATTKALKPKGELKALDDAVAALRARRDELAATVERAAALTSTLAALDERRARLTAERDGIDARAAARAAAQAAELERERARGALARGLERERLVTAVTDAEAALATALDRRTTHDAELLAAAAARTDAEAAVASARATLELASAHAAMRRAHQARDLVAARDAAARTVADERAGAEVLARAGELELALARDEATIAGGAWRLRAVAARPVALEVDGERIELAAGEALERDVTVGLRHSGDDWQELALAATGEAERLAAAVRQHRQELDALLAAAGVVDVAALRLRGQERAAAAAALKDVEGRLAELLGDDDLDTVLAAGASDAGDATAEVRDGVATVAEARRALDAATAVRDRAGGEADRLAAATEALVAAVDAANASVASARAALDAARTEATDDVVAAAAEAARVTLSGVDAEDAGTGESAEAPDPVAERRAIDEALAALADERAAVEADRQIASHAAGQLEDVERELVPSAEELERRRTEALAARRLAARLRAARDDQADRYRAPLRTRISGHLAALLGPGAEVELDEALRITQRRRDGEGWLPWKALSVGAREQLTIVTGLAMAELAGDDGVPFLLDDAIVHSDADRAGALGALLAGTSAQVVVLTCREELLGALPIAEHELVPALGEPNAG